MTLEQLEKDYNCKSAYIGTWKNYKVYDVDLSGCIGLPIYFLEQNNNFRATKDLEGLELLDWQNKNKIKSPFYIDNGIEEIDDF